ncbi:acyltransferase family protein [[Eubacterium] cellulosolvens]
MDSTKIRRYDIDWLRIIAIFIIFLLHVATIFDLISSYIPVRNIELSLELTLLELTFLGLWPMPLFFILSGAATYYALGFRNSRQFVQERIRRILIPFIFGIIIIVPPQVYLEYNYKFSSSYIQFYPQYFEGLYFFGGNFSWFGHHLWYLLLLFVYSLITLPLLVRLRGEKGKKIVTKLAVFFEKSGAIFLPALPIMALEMILPPVGIGTRGFGGWNIFAYILYFIYGYLIFSNSSFQHTIGRYWKVSLALGLITSSIVGSISYPMLHTLEVYWLFINPLFMGLRALSSWFWIVAILGFASLYLNRNNRFLKYANEAVLPFYILHHTVILIIGSHIVWWNMGVAAKYLIISTISFAVILAIYGVIIRPFRVTRFLFGMKTET